MNLTKLQVHKYLQVIWALINIGTICFAGMMIVVAAYLYQQYAQSGDAIFGVILALVAIVVISWNASTLASLLGSKSLHISYDLDRLYVSKPSNRMEMKWVEIADLKYRWINNELLLETVHGQSLKQPYVLREDFDAIYAVWTSERVIVEEAGEVFEHQSEYVLKGKMQESVAFNYFSFGLLFTYLMASLLGGLSDVVPALLGCYAMLIVFMFAFTLISTLVMNNRAKRQVELSGRWLKLITHKKTGRVKIESIATVQYRPWRKEVRFDFSTMKPFIVGGVSKEKYAEFREFFEREDKQA